MIALASGRQIEVFTEGTPSPSALFFHHGTPGSALTWEEWLPEVAAVGGFAIAYSRAGYGLSERHEGRTVIANSDDVAEIVEHFGVRSFVSLGWSGGGPHCIADTTLPESLAAISIAGVAPFDAPGLDFLAGMGEENHVEFGAAIEGPAAIQAWMEKYSGGSAKVTGPELIEALGGLIGDADKRSLTPDVAESVASEFRYALTKGYFGWMDDDLAFVEPWGFDITSITKPVELWQGDEDFMVPHEHAKWLAARIPSSQLKFVPGEGHISLGMHQRTSIIESALGYLKGAGK